MSRTADRDLVTLGRLLRVGLIYNLAEGLLSVGAGIAARSVVLVGFGLDSFIEALATLGALIRGGRMSEEGERRLARLVGWTFLGLAAYVAIESAYDLWHRAEVSPSSLGVVVTGVSLVLMPVLGLWKLRIAKRLGSRGLQAEAKETIACAYLSLVAVFGTVIRYAGGPSWV